MTVRTTVAEDPIELVRALASEFRSTAIAAERAGEPPITELARLRETPLVNLHIEIGLGGGGASRRELAQVVAELGKADPGIAAIVAAHYGAFLAPVLHPHGTTPVQRLSASERWIWGDLVEPSTPLVAVAHADGSLRVGGTARAAIGIATSDVLVFNARRADGSDPVFAYVPVEREGLTVLPGRPALGLRRATAQAVVFEDVLVHSDEQLGNGTGRPGVSLPPLRDAIGDLLFGAVYAGAGLGALESARAYLISRQSPRPGQEAAIDDPFTQLFFGELVATLAAVEALQDELAERIDHAFARRAVLADSEHEEIRTLASGFRALAARSALDAGDRIFETVGVGAARRGEGLDRFWRDVRLHSLERASQDDSDLDVGRHAVFGGRNRAGAI